MCQNFYDVRTFGAVMSTGTKKCGQVRGPVQLTFARSITPIVALEHSITRMAVATEAEAEKQQGDNRTMGRKHTVPYGLYRAHGFVSAFLSRQTGFSADDLELFYKALEDMFEHDRSAARGQMATRGLYVFQHASDLGNAHAHSLFDRLVVTNRQPESPARGFDAYAVTFDGTELAVGQQVQAAQGVTLLRRAEFQAPLARLGDVFRLLLLGALVPGLLSATLGVAVFVTARMFPVGEAPRRHDIVLVTPEPARQVTPAGTTLTTPEGVTLTFPPDAVRAPDIDETHRKGELPRAYVARMAREKASTSSKLR